VQEANMTVTTARSLWKKIIPYLAATAFLGAAGTAVAHRYMGGGDCCASGAPCCKPGAACCNNGKHLAQH
jgi:hypothetical protein